MCPKQQQCRDCVLSCISFKASRVYSFSRAEFLGAVVLLTALVVLNGSTPSLEGMYWNRYEFGLFCFSERGRKASLEISRSLTPLWVCASDGAAQITCELTLKLTGKYRIKNIRDGCAVLLQWITQVCRSWEGWMLQQNPLNPCALSFYVMAGMYYIFFGVISESSGETDAIDSVHWFAHILVGNWKHWAILTRKWSRSL